MHVQYLYKASTEEKVILVLETAIVFDIAYRVVLLRLQFSYEKIVIEASALCCDQIELRKNFSLDFSG